MIDIMYETSYYLQIFFCLGRDYNNLGASFEWGGAREKIPQINASSNQSMH